MKKFELLFVAASAISLTACTLTDGVESVVEQPVQEELTPVAFDTYAGSYGNTRGGATGTLALDKLQSDGFGVFGYYHANNTTYNASTSTPDFMYNQKVSKSGGSWTYSPFKYWPNHTLKDGTGETVSTDVERLSFLAYAPYLEIDKSTTVTVGTKTFYPPVTSLKSTTNGTDEVGILGLSNEAGDTYVAYRVSHDPAKSVDLLWATAADASYKAVNPEITDYTYTAGEPMLNLSKPVYDQKLKFQFHHLLTRFEADIQAAIDQVGAGGTYKDGNTKIVIEKFSIVTDEGTSLGRIGYFNLNSSADHSKWTGTNQGWTITEKYPSHVVSFADIDPDLQWVDATQDADYFDAQPAGIPATSEKNLFGSGEAWMFIPVEGASSSNLSVTLKYRVITKDPALDKGFFENVNEITRKISVPFAMGKSYKLKIIVGMTSVQFDVNEDDWNTDGVSEHTIDMPKNGTSGS